MYLKCMCSERKIGVGGVEGSGHESNNFCIEDVITFWFLCCSDSCAAEGDEQVWCDGGLSYWSHQPEAR